MEGTIWRPLSWVSQPISFSSGFRRKLEEHLHLPSSLYNCMQPTLDGLCRLCIREVRSYLPPLSASYTYCIWHPHTVQKKRASDWHHRLQPISMMGPPVQMRAVFATSSANLGASLQLYKPALRFRLFSVVKILRFPLFPNHLFLAIFIIIIDIIPLSYPTKQSTFHLRWVLLFSFSLSLQGCIIST